MGWSFEVKKVMLIMPAVRTETGNDEYDFPMPPLVDVDDSDSDDVSRLLA